MYVHSLITINTNRSDKSKAMNAQGGLLLLPCMLHGDEDTNPHASAELVVVHDPAGDQGQDTTKTLASRYDGVTEEFDLHTAWPVANKKKNLQILSDTIS
jgi:hypothetical protein